MLIRSESILKIMFSVFLCAGAISAQVTFQEFKANGQSGAFIVATVSSFRSAIGGGDNGVGGSFKNGRREINWDGVPDSAATPNSLPSNFFNVTSPRGVVFANFKATNGNNGPNNRFFVSAKSGNPTSTPVRFGEINAQYPGIFKTFSAERLFRVSASNLLEVNFFVPGTKIPATVSSFGVVFCDVDAINNTGIEIYAPDGSLLRSISAEPDNTGLSFVGVVVSGERIARVVIKTGNLAAATLNLDDNANPTSSDIVMMDDFIYGEPRAAQYHQSDFDGDGVTDRAQFRPSTGQWFILNSGSNTLSTGPFGTNGDVPVAGDFDGDQLGDLAVWRPSTGQWFILRSSDNQVMFLNLGSAGDRPVPGDYDRDGKTDPAVWRESNAGWFYLESSNNYNSFNVIGFGSPGDIPVPGSSY